MSRDRDRQPSVFWARWLARSRSGPEAGLTLIECIVAIVMLAVAGVAVTPPLFLATASRVQTNRAEQAIQLAQGEIDKVRVQVELSRPTLDGLPKPGSDDIQETPEPGAISDQMSSTFSTGAGSCDDTVKDDFESPPASTLLPVDVNGDCQSDFLVQSFRSPNATGAIYRDTESGDRIPLAFKMGVRVWVDIPEVRNNLGSLDKEPASLALTVGSGEQGIKPLAVLYTQIARSDARSSYSNYCRMLGGTVEQCGSSESAEPETP